MNLLFRSSRPLAESGHGSRKCQICAISSFWEVVQRSERVRSARRESSEER